MQDQFDLSAETVTISVSIAVTVTEAFPRPIAVAISIAVTERFLEVVTIPIAEVPIAVSIAEIIAVARPAQREAYLTGQSPIGFADQLRGREGARLQRDQHIIENQPRALLLHAELNGADELAYRNSNSDRQIARITYLDIADRWIYGDFDSLSRPREEKEGKDNAERHDGGKYLGAAVAQEAHEQKTPSVTLKTHAQSSTT